MNGSGSMVEAIWDARRAFLAADENPQPPLAFWLNLLDQQVIEAREHMASGLDDKAHAEIADCILVAFQALHALRGRDPEPFVADRIRTRVIPRVAALIARDRAGNGYKEAR